MNFSQISIEIQNSDAFGYIEKMAFGKNKKGIVSKQEFFQFFIAETGYDKNDYPKNLSADKLFERSSNVLKNELTLLFHQSMAYDLEILSLEESNLLADNIMKLFNNPLCLTNADPMKISDDSFSLGGWNPFSTHTFDFLIALIDTESIGFLLFYDED